MSWQDRWFGCFSLFYQLEQETEELLQLVDQLQQTSEDLEQ